MSLFAKAKKARENKKGFTLVELIVVLVILAILAAIMVPALTGWIDKAKEKQLVLNARSAYLAAQTLASEEYAKPSSARKKPAMSKITSLADTPATATFSFSWNPNDGVVNPKSYTEGGKTIYWTAGGWSSNPS